MWFQGNGVCSWRQVEGTTIFRDPSFIYGANLREVLALILPSLHNFFIFSTKGTLYISSGGTGVELSWTSFALIFSSLFWKIVPFLKFWHVFLNLTRIDLSRAHLTLEFIWWGFSLFSFTLFTQIHPNIECAGSFVNFRTWLLHHFKPIDE